MSDETLFWTTACVVAFGLVIQMACLIASEFRK